MVGVARIELATPAMSTQCSTTELYAHADRALRMFAVQRNWSVKAGYRLRLKNPVDFHDEVFQMKRL
jgi:hypothetical protein